MGTHRPDPPLPAQQIGNLPIRERIRRLVQFRLDAVKGQEEALRRALAVMAQPRNVARALKTGWRSADRSPYGVAIDVQYPVCDIDTLVERTARRSNRPLLKTANPRETLKKLIELRYPVYAEADVTIVSRDVPQDQVASQLIDAVLAYLSRAEKPA